MRGEHNQPKEIVATLWQIEVSVSQGRSVADAIRSIGVTELTH
jgi:putative transposase